MKNRQNNNGAICRLTKSTAADILRIVVQRTEGIGKCGGYSQTGLCTSCTVGQITVRLGLAAAVRLNTPKHHGYDRSDFSVFPSDHIRGAFGTLTRRMYS